MPAKPTKKSAEIWNKIREKRKAIEQKQTEAFAQEEIWKSSLESKLLNVAGSVDPAIRFEPWFINFTRCGNEAGFVMCASCGHGKIAPYRCSLKWCPVCNWRISLRRKTLLQEITKGIPQIKHVVLTQRNWPEISRDKILESRKALFDLRRQKILEKKASGCASGEITNEGSGWHFHWHLLLVQRWIEAEKLAIAWGKLVGQEFAIVKVKSVDGEAYLQEISKYVVKGSEMAKWKPEQILQFIRAIQSTRLFSTFGKFREIAKVARANVEVRKLPCCCPDCGSTELIHGEDENHCSRLINRIYR